MLATGLGAVPVFFLGTRAELLRPILLGVAIGTMTVASIVGLVRPALQEGGPLSVLGGLAAGVAFLVGSGSLLGRRDVHVGELRGAGVRLSALVFGVLLVHSLPEGLAIGTAYASNRAGLSLFVILAIGLQNIPEGTSVAVPMEVAGSPESVLGSRVDERAPTGRRGRRVPARREDRRSLACVLCIRRGSDAGARGPRALAAGLHSAALARGECRDDCRRGGHGRPRRGVPDLTSSAAARPHRHCGIPARAWRQRTDGAERGATDTPEQ